MDKELKSLLIRSNTQKSGSQGVWNELDKVESYVRGINTGQFLDDLSADNGGTALGQLLARRP